MDAPPSAADAANPDLPLGVLLFIPARAMEAATMDGLARAGYTDMTVAQARIAARIDPGGSRITQLAAAAHVTKQTAGSLVEQLERAGYVERVADPTDGRGGHDPGGVVRRRPRDPRRAGRCHHAGRSDIRQRDALGGRDVSGQSALPRRGRRAARRVRDPRADLRLST